jgi:pyridoxamine 5'-phosphate oxidase
MKEKDIQKIRKDYTKLSLDTSEVEPNPFAQFSLWFKEAVDSEIPEPNAFTLSTVDATNKPHSRIVLLKGLEDDTFKFYTNYASDKGEEIASNPNVSLCFFWIELERQVRVDGVASKLKRPESEAYFTSRPHMSQIGAHASNQSEEVPSRAFLDEKFTELLAKFEEGNVPMPDAWGGYKVAPEYFEFWQGRPSRLHDRIVYEKSRDLWQIKRLSP